MWLLEVKGRTCKPDWLAVSWVLSASVSTVGCLQSTEVGLALLSALWNISFLNFFWGHVSLILISRINFFSLQKKKWVWSYRSFLPIIVRRVVNGWMVLGEQNRQRWVGSQKADHTVSGECVHRRLTTPSAASGFTEGWPHPLPLSLQSWLWTVEYLPAQASWK